jgi:hypothetical protein
MANDPQDQQVANRPGQTASVPLPEGLQPNTPVPSEFSGWNKIYVKEGEPIPPGWTNAVSGPTHTMLTNSGDDTREVPVAQMQTARGQGHHVAIPMQAPAPDNRQGWVPLHNAMAALKAGFQHVGQYKQAMDDAVNAVRDGRADIANAAADAIAKHTANYDLMPPEIQNDLKEMVGMGVGFFTGGLMTPGPRGEEARKIEKGTIEHPLTSTLPPVGLGGTTIEPSEPSMQLGRVPEKPVPVERQLVGEPTKTLEAKVVEPGVYEAAPAASEMKAAVKVPPEQSTGKPEWDEAIKKGGAIPGGFQKGSPEDGIPNYAQFHDPQTGSSHLVPEDRVTPENVAASLAKSREAYAAAAEPEKADLIMSEKQAPLKEPYKIEVTDPTGNAHSETIQAFSVQDARRMVTKQFPDAKSYRLESFGEHTPLTDYVVPTGNHLSMPESGNRTTEDTIYHELGHAMVGQNEGMNPDGGMLRHTHPDIKGQGARAAIAWSIDGLYGPGGLGNLLKPEKAPGLVRSFMGGVAADEIRGTPRAANINFDPDRRGSDGSRAMKVLQGLGYDSARATEIMHQAIDANKQYLTNPAVKSVIDENANVRESNLSRQFHFSPERLKNMHAEAQRRIQSGTPTPDNGTVNGESVSGRTENVAGAENAGTQGAGSSVPVQATLPFGSSPEAVHAVAAAPPVEGLHPQAQDWAGTVQKISAKMGKDAAIEAGRRIANTALGDQRPGESYAAFDARRPEVKQLHDWLNKWESTVSPKELAARMNMLESNPLKIIQGSGENPKNAEQAATAAGVPEISANAKKNLLSVNADAKTIKGQKKGYLTGILYLAPDTTSGIANTCPFATEGCRQACLFTAGRAGMFPEINKARIGKTGMFKFDRSAFMNTLSKNITRLVGKADREGFTPAIRLNGTSDLPWENVKGADGKSIMEQFPDVQFYDYTKNPSRMDQYLKGGMPKNYHLTFSRSETNDAATMQILKDGGNAAVVFQVKRGHPLPTDWNGYKVIDGDETDVRFLDDKSTVIGLRAKGKAKKDTTGFVLNVKTPETK